MALARIYSCSPDQASALIHDLEQQGYRVEVLRPEETPSGPADLEIEYELCDTDRAVERARQLAAQLDADVAVENGALDPASSKPAPDIVSASSEPNPASVPRSEPLKETEAEDPEGDRDMPAGSPSEEDLGVVETRPSTRIWSRDMVALIAVAGNAMRNLRALWLAGLQKMREQREKAAIQAVEASVRREQKLLELTCRRAEALQRSRQVEAARRAASGYLTQLQRETGPAESTPAGTLPAAPPEREGASINWWTPSQHVKSIAAGAAAAGALFALTLGISALRSRPSATSVNPPAPVAGPPQVTVENRKVVAHEVPARPSPAVRQRAQKPLSSVTRKPAIAQDSAQADDSEAADVVVRHFGASKPSQKLQSQVSKGVKRYSDLDE